MIDRHEPLRVALIAGMLRNGGAEKQLAYMAKALHQAGVQVRVYSLTPGGVYEPILQAIGVQVIWIGRRANPILRLVALVHMLWSFRPHVIQATHSYANIYAGIAGRILKIKSLGALRSSLPCSNESNGAWGHWSISIPTALLVNSQAAMHEVLAARLVGSRCVYLLPNVIDLADFDQTSPAERSRRIAKQHNPMVMFVGSLLPIKRLDRFLHVLAISHGEVPNLRGIVVGDGPERKVMEQLATEVGLLPGAVTFLGERSDVPALLRDANMLCMTSDDEGFPNVILEAMAAGLPVVTTPAGDAGLIVQDGVTGYVVPFDDIAGMAARVIQLAQDSDLALQLGAAGRYRVEQMYSFEGLARRLLSIYRSIAEQQGDDLLRNVLYDQSGYGVE
jgi:glycosyltransferase involved in cell wall biosynthesis